MRFPFAAALVLIALALVGMASAGYTERLSVRIFDQSFRPVNGAQAYVDYQLNAITGYVKTKPKLTNESGAVELLFTDYEEINESTLTSYTLYVKYGQQEKTQSLVARGLAGGNPSRIINEFVVAHVVFVSVHDPKGKPISAKVSLDGKTVTSDASGNAVFQLPPGEYALKAELAGAVVNKAIDLTKDQAVDIEIPIYPLEVKVTDDSGEPLQVLVSVNGVEKETNSRGAVFFENVSGQSAIVTVMVGQTQKHFKVDMERQQTLAVVFDQTEPTIENLHVTTSKLGEGTLSFFVNDAGKFASGVDAVSVSYETNGAETDIYAYSVGYNTFEAKIPPQAPGTAVKYFVRAHDKYGNSGFATGGYIVPAESTVTQLIGNSSSAQKDQPSATKKNQPVDVNIEMVVVFVVVFAVISYGAFYYYRKRSRLAPPPVPPSQPPPIPR